MSSKEDVLCPCAMPGIEEYRVVTFPDGIQVRLKGLMRIFEEAYTEGKRPDRKVAGEILEGISALNYIPSSAWAEYEAMILREYRKYVEAREECRPACDHVN